MCGGEGTIPRHGRPAAGGRFLHPASRLRWPGPTRRGGVSRSGAGAHIVLQRWCNRKCGASSLHSTPVRTLRRVHIAAAARAEPFRPAGGALATAELPGIAPSSHPSSLLASSFSAARGRPPVSATSRPPQRLQRGLLPRHAATSFFLVEGALYLLIGENQGILKSWTKCDEDPEGSEHRFLIVL